jgi:hypothetical protein
MRASIAGFDDAEEKFAAIALAIDTIHFAFGLAATWAHKRPACFWCARAHENAFVGAVFGRARGVGSKRRQ